MSRSALRSPIDALNFEDVVKFCAEQHREGLRLEYKADFSGKDASKQIAKEVCAFANMHGGTLIFGVEEHPPKSRLPEPKPDGKLLGDDPHHRVIHACNLLSPAASCEVSGFLENPQKPGHGVLIVRVRQSPDLPHALNGRYYVRDHDVSEPRSARRDELELMIDRRRDRVGQQAARVQRGIDRLVRALGTVKAVTDGPPTGYIAVAIGPTICETPLIEPNSIRCPDRRPLNSSMTESVMDGSYAVDECGEVGWLADEFGNAVRIRSDRGPLVSVDKLGMRFAPDWLGVSDGIAVAEVLAPLALCINDADRFCQECSYYGLLTLKVCVRSLLRYPLVFDSWRGNLIIAACRTDTDAEFSMDFASTDMPEAGWEIALKAATRLLRAWNQRSDTSPARYLDAAECLAFGGAACPNHPSDRHRRPRPSHRKVCLDCRLSEKPASQPSEPASEPG